uniref:G-protein coupled receptors family 1 profile domain-containing protein n=1 Tax=Eptatretus burgeri TaxID=7764 RepID=A0A8C4QPH6_EPTBU
MENSRKQFSLPPQHPPPLSKQGCRRQIILLWIFTFIVFLSLLLNAGIVTSCASVRFHKPMLLYISISSLADACWGIVGISCILNNTIAHRIEITFAECLLQMFCCHCAVVHQFLSTWIMYVDRHCAVFWPYTYVALMANRRGALKLVFAVEILAFFLSISYPMVSMFLEFCNDSAIVQDSFCLFTTVARSSCGSSSIATASLVVVFSFVFGLTGFTALYSTYCIIWKCRNSSKESNVKALHTCLTQLMVTSLQFIFCILIVVMKKILKRPSDGLFLDLFATVTPGTVNPLIFGFRTQEIRVVFVKTEGVLHAPSWRDGGQAAMSV